MEIFPNVILFFKMMLQHTEEGGGVIVALQNEFTEIFIYNFLRVFTENKMSFILTFLQMSNFVKFAILNDITSPPLMQRLCHW